MRSFLSGFKQLALFILLLFPINILSFFPALSNDQIIDAAKNFFSQVIGFDTVMENFERDKEGQKGRVFELEAALFALGEKNQIVEGFSLQIEPINGPQDVCFAGIDFQFRTTEYDVVTNRYLIEAKNCRNLHGSKAEYQFNKEHHVLGWLRLLRDEINNGRVGVDVLMDRNKWYLSLNGDCTKNVPLGLTCSWLANVVNKEAYRSLWKELLEEIYAKKFVVFSKNKVGNEFVSIIEEEGIKIVDGSRIYRS
ncbi:TPA: hypothetical protein DEO28_05195 [Candidatus Dependentiae bacterium]|nr:MAG: hypothetical protein UR14_C0002G0152 [candidate division TM6 bacterium GW2011_GWE2_31_21]KKP53949.1 MAG: hypothetical protein UR43_C0002G0152 [candidate division TM6 bacterium GW2011_GWF2_33_332]HBS47729.1 hypothetical protein [Candidatus Dependentiae bacterium]HBZ73878.1 hypothetical protein [Candidatus Dependentiae bacterium]